jgi:invasion protein IalB
MHLGIKGLVLAGLLCGTLPTQAAGNIQGMRFGDWGGNCDAQVCYIQQVLSQGDAPLMVTVIGYAPGKPDPTIIFELPPGIHIKAGVQLQVDNNSPVKFTGSCDKDYCRAGFALDQTIIEQIKRGRTASLSFTPAPKKKPTALPLSLMGVTKGLSMLR